MNYLYTAARTEAQALRRQTPAEQPAKAEKGRHRASRLQSLRKNIGRISTLREVSTGRHRASVVEAAPAPSVPVHALAHAHRAAEHRAAEATAVKAAGRHRRPSYANQVPMIAPASMRPDAREVRMPDMLKGIDYANVLSPARRERARLLGRRAIAGLAFVGVIAGGMKVAAPESHDSQTAGGTTSASSLMTGKAPKSGWTGAQRKAAGPSSTNLAAGDKSVTIPVPKVVPTREIPTSAPETGVEGPYTLEKFSVAVLKRLADMNHVPEANAVTPEHIVGLVAFAEGEGGDINNHDLYNPLNTGLNAPALIDGHQADNGVQSFNSFDAGVEATAATMMRPTQSRLAQNLIDPTTDAEDFMYALTYYDAQNDQGEPKYDGNLYWAEASIGNQSNYYQERLDLVDRTRADYADIAGLVIGTPDREERIGLTAPVEWNIADGQN